MKSAVVSICGSPNVGKSTLVNSLVGEKIAIVSDKPQTTRNRITGIAVHGDTQFVLLDTPGFHKPKNKLGQYMINVINDTVFDVDCILFVVEPKKQVGEKERVLIDKIRSAGIPCILVINKIDTVERAEILAVISTYNEMFGFTATVPISAKTGDGLSELMEEMEHHACESPHLFPDDMITDQPERQLCAEMIREKMLNCLDHEIPHGVAVEITRFFERPDGIIDIEAVIYCEKASHKGIIIGKNGSMLKKIGSLARAEIERFLDCKIVLKSWVKVKENWRDSDYLLSNFGFVRD